MTSRRTCPRRSEPRPDSCTRRASPRRSCLRRSSPRRCTPGHRRSPRWSCTRARRPRRRFRRRGPRRRPFHRRRNCPRPGRAARARRSRGSGAPAAARSAAPGGVPLLPPLPDEPPLPALVPAVPPPPAAPSASEAHVRVSLHELEPEPQPASSAGSASAPSDRARGARGDKLVSHVSRSPRDGHLKSVCSCPNQVAERLFPVGPPTSSAASTGHSAKNDADRRNGRVGTTSTRLGIELLHLVRRRSPAADQGCSNVSPDVPSVPSGAAVGPSAPPAPFAPPAAWESVVEPVWLGAVPL